AAESGRGRRESARPGAEAPGAGSGQAARRAEAPVEESGQPSPPDAADMARIADVEPTPEQLRLVHKAIRAVTDCMEQLKPNAAIAALIDLNTEMMRWPAIPRASAEAFVLLLAPLAPHVAEELWWKLRHGQSLAHERWPEWDERVLAEAQIEIPVQVMG